MWPMCISSFHKMEKEVLGGNGWGSKKNQRSRVKKYECVEYIWELKETGGVPAKKKNGILQGSGQKKMSEEKRRLAKNENRKFSRTKYIPYMHKARRLSAAMVEEELHTTWEESTEMGGWKNLCVSVKKTMNYFRKRVQHMGPRQIIPLRRYTKSWQIASEARERFSLFLAKK